MLEEIHERFIKRRRVEILLHKISRLLPERPIKVLDIGCGDGSIAKELMAVKKNTEIVGIDPLVRLNTSIPVTYFDGFSIPFDDLTYDFCLLIDVVHHADDPASLLSEAVRVSRGGLIIKDHYRQGLLAQQTLRFMDNVHNKRYGVALPYHYWTPGRWSKELKKLDLTTNSIETRINLYPWWADWVFGRGLHFIGSFLRL
jgi:SAM-dependent methyltransferase